MSSAGLSHQSERLIYPTALRKGEPTRLDTLFDLCESANLAIGRVVSDPAYTIGWDYRVCLLSPAFTLSLGLEPLIDARHTFAAETLLRPILERVGSYFCIASDEVQYLPVWNKGWKQGRPYFVDLLEKIPLFSQNGMEAEAFRKFVKKTCNRTVHSGPDSIVHMFDDTDIDDVKLLISGPLPEGHPHIERVEAMLSLVLMSVLQAAEAAFPAIVPNS